MTKIAVLVGSLRAESFNRTLAKNLEELAPNGVEFEYVDMHLPLYNDDMLQDFPAVVQKGKEIIEAADGVLFVTPEYNRGVSGVLKNAIDWMSRPYGSNSFDGKPAGIVGVSSGQIGTAVAQSHLRGILVYLNMTVMGQPEVYFSADKFDDEGVVVEGSQEYLVNYMAAFTDWVRSTEAAKVSA